MNFLKTTQYKIAILISVVTSLFVLITSFSIILIFNTRIDHSAKNSLFSEINKLQVEVEQENIQDKDLKLKENQLTKDEYVFNRVLPNISSESEKIEQPTDINIQKLEESKIVFSKVIDSKGNIVSTSELFQNYVIDTAREGFAKHNVSNTVCLYSYSFHVSSGEYEGYIIQVANYCPINRLELGILYTLCVAISIVISLTTYIGGFIIAKIILIPIEQTVESVRNFGRTVRHELLTPLTVILSTIEASLKTKKYKEGLESSKLDLIESLNSLQLLGNLVPDKQNFTRVNINEVIDEEIQFVKKTLSSTKQIRFFPDCTVKLNANLTGVHIVIRNLLNNAIKYSCDSDSISIFLDNQSIKIENQISDIVNKGMGVGLKIVKEICNYHKWKFETKKTSKTFKVIIKFNL